MSQEETEDVTLGFDLLKKKRSVLRRSLTKLVNRVVGWKDKQEIVEVIELKTFEIQLKSQRDELTVLDSKILGFLLHDADEETCDKEVDEASDYKEKITRALVYLDQKVNEGENGDNATSCRSASPSQQSISRSESKESLASSFSGVSDGPNGSSRRRVRVRLPELHVERFSGKVYEFQAFWDSFSSAIHLNEDLADVDKLQYLKAFLDENTKQILAGLPITDKNYDIAVTLLKKRFARPAVIQHAHMNQLIGLSPVFNEDNFSRLRNFRDQVEAHFRGLEAMSVDKITYSAIVVPVLMDKLPKQIQLNMVRGVGKTMLEWTLDEFIKALDSELEVRECHASIVRLGISSNNQPPRRPKQDISTTGPSTASALMTTGNQRKCVFCGKDHASEECSEKDPEERKNILKRQFRCFICLKGNHRSFECKSKARCKCCKGRHNVAICTNISAHSAFATPNPNAVPASEEFKQANAALKLNPNAAAYVGSACSGGKVALQTAVANVNGMKEGKVRVLFDSGSHRSFITAAAVEKLRLRPVRSENLSIKAFGSNEAENGMREVVEFHLVPVGGGKKVKISCFVVKSIGNISNIHLEEVKQVYPHLNCIWFSDVCRNEEVLDIQVLIGSDYQWEFLEGEQIRGGPHEPVAIKTSLGWVLSGQLKGKSFSFQDSVVNFVQSDDRNENSILQQVNKLWDLDSLGIRPENDVSKESFLNKIQFTGDRYSVKLPWKAGHGPIPQNYSTCVARLKNQLKKLKEDPDVLKEYDKIINEQIQAGIVSTVTEMEDAQKISYLPHSAVIRQESETTKVRIVYDASCKDKVTKSSLNDCLHVGPPLTPHIVNILLRFRMWKVALVGDIAKAFLMIEVDPADRDVLRFLWVKDVNAEAPEIIVLRFNRVVFGVNSSPYLLNVVIQHHINSFQELDPQFVSKLSQSFYVDDLVTGANTEKEALSLYCNARERMKMGGFVLRKWKTNSEMLTKQICLDEEEGKIEIESPIGEEQTYAKETLGSHKDAEKGSKVLGIPWDNKNDALTFDLTKIGKGIHVNKPTKRIILSSLATLFDPLGLISPISVQAKVLFQDLCTRKIDWDDPIPREKSEEWDEWISSLDQVKSISIPRGVFSENESEILSYELHGFGDASQKAYSALVYLCYETEKGIFTKLLCAKTRVAPLKSLSIPRLELMSARVLVVLMSNVIEALSSIIKIETVRFWLDSKTALYWIYNNGEWKQWVQFRVAEILKMSDKEQWGHVAGKDNPADIGSRGVTASYLSTSELWWEGPEWLRRGESEWPTSLVLRDSTEVACERKKVCTFAVIEDEGVRKVGNVIELDRYGSLERLLRVTAWVKRFVSNLKKAKAKRNIKLGELEVAEIGEAERSWILDAQEDVKSNASFEKTRVNLGLVKEDGIYICRGRLANSDLEAQSKFPIILPRDHRFTHLVILDCHKRVHHLKVGATLAELRSKFWVPKGRQCVKKIIKPCFRCKLLDSKAFNAPVPAPLPDFRVTEAPAFSQVGIDYAGPLFVKVNGEMTKAYFCIFSCTVVRAVHLELVLDQTTSTFLNCFRRFCARRGTPRLVISDNAKTFKAANKMLHNLLSKNEVGEFLTRKRIIWRYNLERSPWWGGHFERMIGTVKRCLKKVLGTAKLSQDELSTVLTEVESTLNSRPLTYYGEELEEQVLTPSHLIIGRRISPLSENDNISLDSHDIAGGGNWSRRFVYLTKKLNHFWTRWHKEYLLGLRETHRLQKFLPNDIAEGDTVLIHEEKTKRNTWKLGIIEELIRGKDQVIRGAKVRKLVRGKPEILCRPLQKLVPLESYQGRTSKEGKSGKEGEKVNEDANEEKNVGLGVKSDRPRRAAAANARLKSRLMLEA